MTMHPTRGRNHLNHHGWCQCLRCQPPKNTQEPKLDALEFNTNRATIKAEAIEQDGAGEWRVHWRAFLNEGETLGLNESSYGNTHVNLWNQEIAKWK